MNIGFFGVGNMGGPMAANLVKAGHTVRVYDLSAALAQHAVELGCEMGRDPLHTVADADVVISMLPSGKAVAGLYLGDEGVLAHIDPKTLVIDCSTIDTETTRALADAAGETGHAVIDAPVSGGVGGATAGTLTFICGGEEAAVARARPVLECMGKNVFHAGGHGAGQVAKICNNMLLAIHMIGTCEALQLGADTGLDPTVLSDIMLASSGRNWSLEVYNPWPGVMDGVPSSKEYAGGFAVDLMNKDLTLALETALAKGSRTPMGSLAKSLYGVHGSKGQGRLDFSSIQKLYRAED